MNCVRSSLVACVLTIGGLGLEAAKAEDRGHRDASPASASAPDHRSRLRKWFDSFKGKESESSYPRNRDWSTGLDNGMSKPWLRR